MYSPPPSGAAAAAGCTFSFYKSNIFKEKPDRPAPFYLYLLEMFFNC
jgi:hypothetical protein